MCHFEIAIGHVVVADERTAIGPHGHGCVFTYLAGIVQGGELGRSAEPVGAVSYLQSAVS